VPLCGASSDKHLGSYRTSDRHWVSFGERQTERDVVTAACALVARAPYVENIVLECTKMPPYHAAGQAGTGRQVTDIETSLVEHWFHAWELQSVGGDGQAVQRCRWSVDHAHGWAEFHERQGGSDGPATRCVKSWKETFPRSHQRRGAFPPIPNVRTPATPSVRRA
jgi:hypothetical protein